MKQYKLPRYNIRVSLDTPGDYGILGVKDRVEWCKRRASKHLAEVKPYYREAYLVEA